jgi:pilus assembly protein CpaE
MLRMIAHCFVRTDTTRTQVEQAFADRRLAKVVPTFIAGGFTEAISRYAGEPSPPLIVIEADDGTGGGDGLLDRIDALAEVCDSGSNLILLGTTNDIDLYRKVLRHGVADYLVAPFDAVRFTTSVLDLFTGPNKGVAGQAIAFIGAKGGSGSSVIAHNTAFALTRSADCDAMVLDLDMPFGSADLGFNVETTSGMRNLLAEPERIDDTFLHRFACKYDERLHLLAAPAVLDAGSHIDFDKLETAVEAVKRNSRYVVLDLPHGWSNWIQQSLRLADTVVVTASLDLASLRNTRNLLDWLAGQGVTAPYLVVNGVADRKAMIELADFTKSLGAKPAVLIPEDRDAFRLAASAGKMIEEVRPKSKAAQAIRQLAGLVAGSDGPAGKGKRKPASGGALLASLFRRRRGKA